MHHIWFLTIGPRLAAYARFPHHQPLMYPRSWRWLIWLLGFFAGGWAGSYRHVRMLALPKDVLHTDHWCNNSTACDHFDWVLDAYCTKTEPSDDIPF